MSIYETSIINPKKQLKFYKNLSEQLEKDNQELKEQLEAVKQVAKDHLKKEIELKIQQKEFIEWLESEKDRLAKECSHTYEDSLGRMLYVNEDIYNEVNKILSKYKKTAGVKDE